MDPVEVVDYDPTWPAQFAEIAARVRAAFADGLLIAVEHIGSTAVVGLAAKPIIDLNVVVPAREDTPEAIARLASLGYVHEGDKGILGREAFLWPVGTVRHHLYVCARDNAEYRRQVAFRDYLREHRDAAQRYEALKRDLAERFHHDRTAYSEGKTAFVEAVLARARG
jgi:GrpB-like predicted nucleotidyltransferase (UPF0157 family)